MNAKLVSLLPVGGQDDLILWLPAAYLDRQVQYLATLLVTVVLFTCQPMVQVEAVWRGNCGGVGYPRGGVVHNVTKIKQISISFI